MGRIPGSRPSQVTPRTRGRGRACESRPPAPGRARDRKMCQARPGGHRILAHRQPWLPRERRIPGWLVSGGTRPGTPEPSSAARPKRRNKPGSIWASSRSKGRTTRWFGRWRQPRRAGRFIANGGWSRSTARRSTSPIRPPTARRSAIRQRPAERARFPKPRFVSLLENGTHVLFASRLGPCASGEITLAKLKTPEPLRQEFYGLRMAHFAIRELLHEAGGPGDRRRSRSILVPARGASGATQASPSGRAPLGTNTGFMKRSSPSCSTNVCVRAAACGIRAESSVR